MQDLIICTWNGMKCGIPVDYVEAIEPESKDSSTQILRLKGKDGGFTIQIDTIDPIYHGQKEEFKELPPSMKECADPMVESVIQKEGEWIVVINPERVVP